MKSKILFIGAGRMGGAILKRLLNKKEYQISAIDPIFKEPKNRDFDGPITLYNNIKEAITAKAKSDIIILCFKPQFFPSLSHSIRQLTTAQTLVISIMAGTRLSNISAALENKGHCVRVMPNIAVTVGFSATVCYADNDTDVEQRNIVSKIFSCFGKVNWINDEEYMHTVTALSGSGPAYYYAFCEILAQIASDMGLPQDLAMQLSVDTMIGAARVLEKQRDPEKLRKSVTSQGGTTYAALDILMQPEALTRLARVTLAAASDRSREISG